MCKYKTRWRAAWRTIGSKAKYYRSSWEANYARYLQLLKKKKSIKEWWYEPKTFYFDKIKLGVRSYLPDFKVLRLDRGHHWVEVKGWMDSKSKTKIKRFRKYYPKEELIIVGKKWFDENSKKLSKVCKGWEHPKPRIVQKNNNNINKKRKNKMAVECTGFKIHKSGALLGFADLFSSKTGLVMRGCPMFQKQDGGRWIKLPSREYQEEGETKYSEAIRFKEKPHHHEFVKQAVKAIEKWCEENETNLDDADKEQINYQEELPF